MVFVTGYEIDIVMKLAFAAFLGSLIGIERELHYRPAGMRTHALVAMGSALFAIISVSVVGNVDPSRIASGVVTGIGFLGAGTIFFSKNRLHGLTTAADLWVVAGVGLACGTGMYLAAFAAAVIALFVLVVGKQFEKKALHEKK